MLKSIFYLSRSYWSCICLQMPQDASRCPSMPLNSGVHSHRDIKRYSVKTSSWGIGGEGAGLEDRRLEIVCLHADRLARGVQSDRPPRRSAIKRAQCHGAACKLRPRDQADKQGGLSLGKAIPACRSRRNASCKCSRRRG